MLLTVKTLPDCLSSVSALKDNQEITFTVNFPETQTVTVRVENGGYLVNDTPKAIEDIFQELGTLAVSSLYYREHVLGSSEYLEDVEIPVVTVSVNIGGESEGLECVSAADYLKILDTLMSKNGLSVTERNKAASERPDVHVGSFAFYTKDSVVGIIGKFTTRL